MYSRSGWKQDKGEKAVAFRENWPCGRVKELAARWLSWLKRLTSNEEIPSSNLGRAFLFFNEIRICDLTQGTVSVGCDYG